MLVTGGCSGIGAAAAAALAELGFRPIAADIAPRPTPSTVLLWDQRFDIADDASVEDGVKAIEAQHGPLVGLVNAAGILGKMHPPERLRMADWDHEMRIDLRGSYLTARAVGRVMVERRRGAIVNIASIVGMGSAPAHAYTAAKAGVIGMTSALAAEWGPRGVRVNAVSPGFTRTPALERGLVAGVLSEAVLSSCAALNRLVEPEEVGRAVAWLISDASSGVTGINLPVDAGVLAGTAWLPYGGLRGGDTVPQNADQATQQEKP